MRKDLEGIEARLTSGNQFLNFTVVRTQYVSPVLREGEGALPLKDYLEFLAYHLRRCVENPEEVSNWSLSILQAYRCPHVPRALTPSVEKMAQVIPLFPNQGTDS
jgi:hypothetical protein